MDYDYLRQEYPAVISMDQFYRICHISKRKARWLLENGVVPCKDSGKQTRRFSIQLEDVIRFLEQRDAGLVDAIPQGIFSSTSSSLPRPPKHALDESGLSAYLLAQWQGWPDMLTAQQASELCGYTMNTLNRWWNLGRVEGLKYRGTLLYSKESLACWLASVKGQNITAPSEQHREWITRFQTEEQSSGMEFGSMPLF